MFTTMMLLGSLLYNILHEAQLLMFLVLHLFKFVFSAIVIEAETFPLFLLRFSMRVILHRIVCGRVSYTNNNNNNIIFGKESLQLVE